MQIMENRIKMGGLVIIARPFIFERMWEVRKMEIQKVKLNDIVLPDYNPRKIDEKTMAKLKRSLKEFGYVEPVVVNKRNMHVVGGNQRVKALKELGIAEVEAVIVNLDDKEEKALNLALNKITGEWDYEKLTTLFKEMDEGNFDITATGFDSDEIDRLLSEISGEKKEQEIEDVEKRAKAGDIWQLGEHRVICADCTDKEALKMLFEGDKANTIVTSPPYAEQRKNEYGGINAEYYPDWFCTVAETIREYLTDTGSFFVNIKEHVEKGQRHLYVMKTVINMVEKYNWRYLDEFVWVKPGLPTGAKNRLKNEFEPVFHFSKQEEITFNPMAVGWESNDVIKMSTKQKTRNGNVGVSGRRDKGIARPGNVIKLSVNQESWKHPAMYPVELPEFFIKLTTNRGDRVFDPFLGAGSTLIAAEKTKRICYGIEKMPEYVDIVLARWEKYTGKKAVRIDG